MKVDDDYSAFVEPTSTDQLVELARLADAQAAAEAEVQKCSEALKKAADRLADIAERELPDLMDSLGMKTFTTTTGLNIEVREEIRASIPRERQAEAMAWLRANNHDSLIKRTITAAFGRGEDSKAETFTTVCNAAGVVAEDKSVVHPQTLSAFIREKLKAGADIPLETFGVFRQRSSKVVRPK